MNKSNYHHFSVVDRSAAIENAESEHFDLIIIGGGVTGCGIALDAVTRGLKVLLVEKNDFASGTSSKSTKLIHGGLRYLKQLEIGLVRETGTERAIVHKNAPHLVHPEKMLLPILEGGTFGKISATLAISVYDFLADVAPKDKKVSFSKSETMESEPLLDENLVKGGVLYSEYRTDDARLTIELMKAAVRRGALAFNYVEMESLSYDENNKVNGIFCKDHLTEKEFLLKSKFVVSAAGPWVDKIRLKDKSLYGKSLHLTKGVHIVVPKDRLPLQQAAYFDVFDGRMIFAIPRGKVTYIGTSDTDYKANLERVVCTDADAEYLVNAVNRVFPLVELDKSDIVSSWAGLRPLIHQDGKSASELSRKDEIFESDQGLISIAGGKLTGYRKMAKRIVKLILEKDETLPNGKSGTKKLALLEDGYINYAEVESAVHLLKDNIQSLGLTDYHAWYLISTYGPAHVWILDRMQDISADQPDKEAALIQAELEYGIKYESVARPEDFLIRRTGRLYFDPDTAIRYHIQVIDQMAEILGWSEEDKGTYHEMTHELINDSTIIDRQ